MIPETLWLLPLASLGVLFSAGMQFLLAWFLWTRLPQSFPAINGNDSPLNSYPETAQRGFYDSPLGFARVPLPSYEYPNYLFANDVCRTVSVVQLICIALFLFSILNNIPAIAKNIFIIWTSTRFVSEDEEGITKIHYWRESETSREDVSDFFDLVYKEAMDKFKLNIKNEKDKNETVIKYGNMEDETKAFLCEMFFKGSFLHSHEVDDRNEKERQPSEEEETLDGNHDFSDFLQEEKKKKLIDKEKDVNRQKYFMWEQGQYALAGRRRWMMPKFFMNMLPKNILKQIRIISPKSQKTVPCGIIPRNVFEVCETRSFLAEALRLIDIDHNTKPVGTSDEIKSYPNFGCSDWLRRNECKSDEGVKVQFCDQVRFNLVRLDYLKPSMIRPSAFHMVETQKGLELLKAETIAAEKHAVAEVDVINAETLLAKAELKYLRAKVKRDLAKKNAQYAREELRSANSKDEINFRQKWKGLEDIATKKDIRLHAKENELKKAVAVKRIKEESRDIASAKLLDAAYQMSMLLSDKRFKNTATVLQNAEEFKVRAKNEFDSANQAFQQTLIVTEKALNLVTETKLGANNAMEVLKDLLVKKEECEKAATNAKRTTNKQAAEDSETISKTEIPMGHTQSRDAGSGGIGRSSEIRDVVPGAVLAHLDKDNFWDNYMSWRIKQHQNHQQKEGIIEIIDTAAEWKRTYWKQQLEKGKKQLETATNSDNDWNQRYQLWRNGQEQNLVSHHSDSKWKWEYWNDEVQKRQALKTDDSDAMHSILNSTWTIAKWLVDEAMVIKDDAKKSLREAEKDEEVAEMKVVAQKRAIAIIEKVMNELRSNGQKNHDLNISSEFSPQGTAKLIDRVCEKLGRDFSDLKTAVLLKDIPAKMRTLRFLATLFGVVPEILTLVMITVAAIPYILWSGFKVDSDTQGMEEIIMATLAVNFIYEIDDAVYDHILPELYKEAHERDRFELARRWTSSETTAILKDTVQDISGTLAKGVHQNEGMKNSNQPEATVDDGNDVKKTEDLKRLMRCAPLVCEVLKPVYVPLRFKPTSNAASLPSPGPASLQSTGPGTYLHCDVLFDQRQDECTLQQQDPLAKECATLEIIAEPLRDIADLVNYQNKKQELELLMNEFDKEMAPITASMALKMSTSDHWNDLYLARAYPFLYSRKLTYVLKSHWWERFLISYGMYGVHYIALSLISLAIVGGYRSLAQCNRFSDSNSVFGLQPWPGTCLLNVGPKESKFSLLNGSTANEFMPVSCGISGYVPSDEEWNKNKDYFTKP